MTEEASVLTPASLAARVVQTHPEVRYKIEGSRVELEVPRAKIRHIVSAVDSLVPDALPECMFGVDLQSDKYELIYIFWSHTQRILCQIRVALEGKEPSLDSVSDIFPGLEWHERETHEMFGIDFKGHPDLRLLLLPDELKGKFPLRKSFQTDRSRLEESGLASKRPAAAKEGGVAE